MDTNANTPAAERVNAAPEIANNQPRMNGLEAQVAPAQVESSQNGPKADDGAANAQAQVAAVTASDDQVSTGAGPAATVSSTPSPQVAADVDVIEPEWVKKAEEAVAQNRDDPRAEEDAVEAVQIDYLKKRYNLDVSSSDKAA